MFVQSEHSGDEMKSDMGIKYSNPEKRTGRRVATETAQRTQPVSQIPEMNEFTNIPMVKHHCWRSCISGPLYHLIIPKHFII